MKLKILIDIPPGGGDPQYWSLWNGHGGNSVPTKTEGYKRLLVHAIIPDELIADADEYLGSEKVTEVRTTKSGRTLVL